MIRLLRRIACFFTKHAWPWAELSGPPYRENLGTLLSHDFACKRCGLRWDKR